MRRIILSLALLLAGCNTGFVINAEDLDSGQISKQSILASAADHSSLSAEQRKKAKVAVLTHGYTASTYEMSALQAHLEKQGYLVSNVLLGGHGTKVEDFAASTWKDWGKPVADEYKKLRALGFENIAVVGSSTGGALFIEMLGSQQLAPQPQRVVLVAPLVVFSAKDRVIAFAGLMEWFGINNFPKTMKQQTEGNWYRNRPTSTLRSLVDLTEIVKEQLREGIALDKSTKVLVIQSDQDPTVDPESARMVQRGLKGSVSLRIIPSSLHVPTWPVGVDRDWTDQEIQQQKELFVEIDEFISQ